MGRPYTHNIAISAEEGNEDLAESKPLDPIVSAGSNGLGSGFAKAPHQSGTIARQGAN